MQAKGYAGLVILVDDLDKMVVRPHSDAGCSTAEYLFVHRSAQLTAFDCHVVYTMPLSLAYSHLEATIKNLYGGHVPVVPMIKISTPPSPARPSRPFRRGVEKMTQMIHQRLAAAGVAEGDIKSQFATPAIIRELIKLSGGQPTELLTIIREAIISDALPLNRDALKRALREGMREYARQLRREHWSVLEEVRATGQFVKDATNEPLIRELLDSRAIVQYVNDIEWYGLNPMVAELTPPGPPHVRT